jgi:hypothetical protein
MAMLAADVGQEMISYVYAIHDDLLAPRARAPFFSGGYPMKTMRVGGTEYQFRRTLYGRVYPIASGEFEFVVDELAPHVVGRASSAPDAINDWCVQVHAALQQMLAMRPFEMTTEDRARWQAFESVIDTAQLRRSTPIRMRQLGCVEYMHYPYPRAVHWVGGGRERVSLEAMPPEFPAYRPGQWIEAICERDPLTSHLLRVTHVERIPDVRLMSRGQQDQYWEALPTSTLLPESDLDWTRAD